jgi:hypothetical protein
VRPFGIVVVTITWIVCWLVAPASWWLNERILDEQAFRETMRQVLQIEDVDAEITDRATAQVMDDAATFVQDTVPLLAGPAQALLDRAEPLVAGAVNTAVNSQPGERAMLAMADQMHAAFVAWLEQDSLGRPGLEADLDDGRVRFDLDELLAGEQVALGPVTIPLDALDLPGLSVPVPLPPDWMRVPLTLVRDALIPALIGIAVGGALLVLLDRGRTRALAVASGLAALVVGGAAMLIRASWSLSGAQGADWTITRAVADLLVRPWLTASAVVVAVLAVLTVVALVADRIVVQRRRA